MREDFTTTDEQSEREDQQDKLIGCLLAGKFRVEKLVGAGGMSFVYRAQQVDLDRHVAIKIPRHTHAFTRSYLHRFAREAQVLSILHHRNIAQIHSAGVAPDGRPFVSMEFVEGQSLRAVLSLQQLGHRLRCLPRFVELADALAHAHENDIVHRDLKPENVMIVAAEAGDLTKVLDFGVAKLLTADDDQRDTATGCVVGTPAYMSPEQFTAQAVDARADIYSFGCILYELVAGHPAFQSDTVFGMLDAHLNQPPQPLSFSAQDENALAGKLYQIALKAMQKEPGQRFQTMRAVSQLLNGLQNDPATSLGFALPAEPPKPRRRWQRRTVGAAIATLFTVTAVCAGVAYTNRVTSPTDADSSFTDHSNAVLALNFSGDHLLALDEAKKTWALAKNAEQKRLARAVLANFLYVYGQESERQQCIDLYDAHAEDLLHNCPPTPAIVKQIKNAYQRSADLAMHYGLPQAAAYAERSYRYTIDNSDADGEFDIYRCMADAALKRGDFQAAIKFDKECLDALDMHTPPESHTGEIACEIARNLVKAGYGSPAKVKNLVTERLELLSRDEALSASLSRKLDVTLGLKEH